MESPQKLFGARVREFRRAQKLSQEDFADQAGLARSYMSDVERGLRNISLQNICKLASVLEVTPAELMDFYPQNHIPRLHLEQT